MTFQKAIKETLILHTCGICDREFGLRDCRLLAELSWEIAASDLNEKCEFMLKPLREPETHNKYQVMLLLSTFLFNSLLYYIQIFFR